MGFCKSGVGVDPTQHLTIPRGLTGFNWIGVNSRVHVLGRCVVKPIQAYKGSDPYIFVCYAHEDEAVVYPEIDWLQEQGIKLWFDEGISGGKIWREEIGDAIKGASNVLYYISKSSLDSAHCSRELNFARDLDKAVLPVYLEEVVLTTDLEVGLSRIQALHRDQDANYQQHLLSALGQTVQAVPRSPLQNLKSPSAHKKGNARPAIAVLPFVNIGDTDDYFSDGVAEEILNRMIRIREVRVISRQSSFAYRDSVLDIREIGNELGVDYIMEGSVRRQGNTVRIAVRLTDATDGAELWGNSYTRELTDILRLQDAIARTAISEFVPNITVAPSANPDVDPVAYDLYLRARRSISANDGRSAKPLLQSAIVIEPQFAEAFGLLAANLNGLRVWGPLQFGGDDELQQVLTKALDLDPENIDALLTEAMLKLYLEFDLQGSISKFESLIRRFPDSGQEYLRPLAVALKRHEMLLVAERGLALYPNSISCAIDVLQANFALGDFEQARRTANRIPLDHIGDAIWTGRLVSTS